MIYNVLSTEKRSITFIAPEPFVTLTPQNLYIVIAGSQKLGITVLSGGITYTPPMSGNMMVFPAYIETNTEHFLPYSGHAVIVTAHVVTADGTIYASGPFDVHVIDIGATL